MEILILSVYGIALIVIFTFSLIQLSLVKSYVSNKKNVDSDKQLVGYDNWPIVTIQLPIFNEKYVIERLLDAVIEMDYPKNKLQIQVLDDSIDDTVEITERKVAEILADGFWIEHIHRTDRTGYKAGALAESMSKVKGDYIAIFDSDFLPATDFLRKTVPLFQNEKLGVVQTRWGHINKDYSLLTKLQAFGLDAHFTIEQVGRNSSKHFINFNGTAGIWRKECIENAGGWHHDTLTEDLDLSYRAQMVGWDFKYLPNLISPAELPVTMSALKSQQFRWMKGGAENFRKNAWSVLKSNKSFYTRLHGLFHLFNSTVFLFIFLISVLSVPILFIKNRSHQYDQLFSIGSFFVLSFFILMIFYWQAYKDTTANEDRSVFNFLKTFILFLSFSMGLSFHNSIAVIEGYMGRKSSFVRTPKFNILDKKDSWKGNKYNIKSLNLITIIEGVLMCYFLFGLGLGVYFTDLGMFPFHVLLFFGYFMVFKKSLIS